MVIQPIYAQHKKKISKNKKIKIRENFNSEVITINIFIDDIARLLSKKVISMYTITMDIIFMEKYIQFKLFIYFFLKNKMICHSHLVNSKLGVVKIIVF